MYSADHKVKNCSMDLKKKKTWKAEVFSKRKEVTYGNRETHKVNNCEIKMSTVTNRSNTWKETMLSTAG